VPSRTPFRESGIGKNVPIATLREHVSACVRAAVPEITGIDVG
jgi:hypothetical protein